MNFGKNIDFEIFVDSERYISSESNGVCFIYETWRFECLFFNFINPTSPKLCKKSEKFTKWINMKAQENDNYSEGMYCEWLYLCLYDIYNNIAMYLGDFIYRIYY